MSGSRGGASPAGCVRMEAGTIAQELERDRLHRQVRRMELVTVALRDRALHHTAVSGTAPSPLRAAIVGFELELKALRRRLEEISQGQTAPGGDRAADEARPGRRLA